MRVITARNVHDALPQALQILDEEGEWRESRNGRVRVVPFPVTTVYQHPQERVIFWPERDANPALHLYEALWMLAGRDDVEPLTRYAKRFADYADEGVVHGAYGHRWRRAFGFDQLDTIARRLRYDPTDRRCVLQMWDAGLDLDRDYKDLPCNTTATLQRGAKGELNLVVFCRSNDVVWGCYGANAVHFSLLLEYMALRIGCPVGTYTQVSVNWHAYEQQYNELAGLPRPDVYRKWTVNPYEKSPAVIDPEVVPTPLAMYSQVGLDEDIRGVVRYADGDKMWTPEHDWEHVAMAVLDAHRIWRTTEAPLRFTLAKAEVDEAQRELGKPYDWLVAMWQWLDRRQKRWEAQR